MRGFALIARCAGLLGHIAKEREQPIGYKLYADIEERATDEPPATEMD